MKIEERHEHEQQQRQCALLGVEVIARQLPSDPKRNRRDRHGEQIERPVGSGENCEPARGQPGRQRRMLGIAESKLARPCEHFGHIDMYVLARLREHGIERPDRDIGQQHDDDRALTPCRVAQRSNQAIGGDEQSAGTASRGHRACHANSRCAQAGFGPSVASMARRRSSGPYRRASWRDRPVKLTIAKFGLLRGRRSHIVTRGNGGETARECVAEQGLRRQWRRQPGCSTGSGTSLPASCRSRPAATSPMPPRGRSSWP